MQRWRFLLTTVVALGAGCVGAFPPAAHEPGYALRVSGPVYTLRRDTLDPRGVMLAGAIPYQYTNPQRQVLSAGEYWICAAFGERYAGRRARRD